jgi:aspartate/methionine/tyrosine aminotransferase
MALSHGCRSGVDRGYGATEPHSNKMVRFQQAFFAALLRDLPRFDLGGNVEPNLRVRDLLNPAGLVSLSEIALSYGTAEGDAALRKAIANSHGASSNEVVVTAGSAHALFLAGLALCGRGDHVVITSPGSPMAYSALEAAGAEVSCVPLSFDEAYQLDLASIRWQLSKRTKLVYLAAPQNPSGVVVPSRVIAELIALMQDVCPKAYLLLDETYRDAAYDEDRIFPSFVGLGTNVISCGSVSHCLDAPGLRIGWIICRDRSLHDQLVTCKFNTMIACSVVDEFLALKILQRQSSILNERRRRLSVGLAVVTDWVLEFGGLIEWVRPDVGASCCIRLRPSVFDDAAVGRFYEELTVEGITVGNGTWFGEETRVFRLGFGFLPASRLLVSLTALSAALKRAR